MTKKERARLRAKIFEMIRTIYGENAGRATPSQVMDRLFYEYPELIDQYGDQLVRSGLSSMINSAFKRADKNEREEMQLNLFGNREPALIIPKSIALPSNDGSREMTWVATTNATVAELDRYISFLAYGIDADQKKHDQLQVFRDRIMELADTDDMDTPIREMLEGLRAKQARAI